MAIAVWLSYVSGFSNTQGKACIKIR